MDPREPPPPFQSPLPLCRFCPHTSEECWRHCQAPTSAAGEHEPDARAGRLLRDPEDGHVIAVLPCAGAGCAWEGRYSIDPASPALEWGPA